MNRPQTMKEIMSSDKPFTEKDIIAIAEHFGIKHQQNKCQEELNELIEAITDMTFGEITFEKRDHLIEEISEVLVMIKQLMYFYEVSEKDVTEIQEEKIQRTLQRYEISTEEI